MRKFKNEFDLTPFHSATVGFEKVLNDLDKHFSVNTGGGNYPPYNIIEETENCWTIQIAVSGFNMEELDITKEKNTLVVQGNKKSDENTESKKYLHKGIGMRNFKRQFALADYVEVEDAVLDLGILSITLVRNLPEEELPKKIEISNNSR